MFVPYSFDGRKDIYFDSRPSFAYGTKTVVWIGARRIGKTYAAKRYATKRYLYNGYQMLWLRDNDEARKKIAANDGKKFFSDYGKTFHNLNGKIVGETITINEETFGYLQPTSTFQNYKGNDYEDIKTVIFDEFIPEHGKGVNSARVWQFINSMYTTLSTRKDAKAILMANALDRGDEILDLFGFKVKDYGLYINREKDVCLHYCDNSPEFNAQRDESIVGRWIKGTQYEDNLFHNKFADDENQFFDRRPPHCELLAILHNEDGAVRVYIKDDVAYCCRDFNSESQNSKRFVSDYRLINTRRALIPKGYLEALRNAYYARRVLFDGGYTKNAYLEFIS